MNLVPYPRTHTVRRGTPGAALHVHGLSELGDDEKRTAVDEDRVPRGSGGNSRLKAREVHPRTSVVVDDEHALGGDEAREQGERRGDSQVRGKVTPSSSVRVGVQRSSRRGGRPEISGGAVAHQPSLFARRRAPRPLPACGIGGGAY